MISVYDKKMIVVVVLHVSIYVLLMQLKWFPMKRVLYPETDQELCIDCGKCIESCA